MVRRTVNAQLMKLRQCYEQGLAHDPTLTGSALVRFAVQSDGHVDQVDTAGSALPSPVRGCIERVFLGLSFPHPGSSPAHVEYPIDFRP
ncbi:MAG: AgmX/PglI C-terminal domain-containing protein [Deltaproteobacteria bacterium]